MIKVPATRAGLQAVYVEALVGPDSVDTLPPETLAAYRDGGPPALTIENDLDAARALPQRLGAHGIDLEAVAEALEREGVRKFIEPYDALLHALAQRTFKQ
jgi:transaldolase